MTGLLSDYLSGDATYLHFGDTFMISVGNLIVILSMFALFTLALFLPFPGSGKKSEKVDKK